jgi:hypothetical protein
MHEAFAPLTLSGAALDAFLRDTAPASRQRRAWTPEGGPMLALYLSHGADRRLLGMAAHAQQSTCQDSQ